MRGGQGAIPRARAAHTHVPYYDKLKLLMRFYEHGRGLPLDDRAAPLFEELHRAGLRPRIAPIDRTIAASVQWRPLLSRICGTLM